MGFEFIHMGEFAWTFFEPEEGKFDFEWFDYAISLAEKYNLKIILCAPSAAAPVWLSEKYPEILMVDENGVTIKLAEGVEGILPAAKMETGVIYEAGKSVTVLIDTVDTKKHKIALAPMVTSTEGLIYK